MHHRARHAPRRTRGVVANAFVAAAVALVGACGLGDKSQLEERITSAPARYEGTVVSGTITVESRLMKVPPGISALGALGAPAVPGAPGAPAAPPEFPREGVSLGVLGVGFVLDLASSRAALRDAEAAPPATEAKVVFEDLVLHGRRGGVPPDDARPWVRLDLDDLDDTAGALDPLDGGGANAVYALHPALLVDLVAGTLTGSIEKREDDALEAGSSRYDVNVSIRKALQDTRRSRYPEQRRESVEEVLRLLGVVGDLHPGEVWLDAEGRIRRFRIEFLQEPRRKIEFRMIVSVEVAPSATAEPADPFRPPGVDQVLGVDSVLRFTSTVVATGADEGDPDDGSADAAADAPPAETPAPTAPEAVP